jgi:ClpP class serine protease
MSRPWDDREQAVVRKMAQRVYDTFTARVKASRGKRVKDIATVAQGRIFTARQAVGNGLIDEVGGLREALLAAQSAARIKSSFIITLPRPKTIADLLYGGGASSASPAAAGQAQLLRQLGGPAGSMLPVASRQRAGLAYLLSLAGLFETESVLAALPYHVTIRP